MKFRHYQPGDDPRFHTVAYFISVVDVEIPKLMKFMRGDRETPADRVAQNRKSFG